MSEDEHIKLLQGHVARLQQELAAITARHTAAIEKMNMYANQCAALQSGYLKIRVALGLDLHSTDSLLDVIAELRQDAGRYRWLRNDAADSELGVYMWVASNGRNQRTWLAMSELDKAIDAAMKGE